MLGFVPQPNLQRILHLIIKLIIEQYMLGFVPQPNLQRILHLIIKLMLLSKSAFLTNLSKRSLL